MYNETRSKTTEKAYKLLKRRYRKLRGKHEIPLREKYKIILEAKERPEGEGTVTSEEGNDKISVNTDGKIFERIESSFVGESCDNQWFKTSKDFKMSLTFQAKLTSG